MKIKTIFTDTRNNLTALAIAQGWKEKVIDNVEGEQVEVPNPVTLEMFLQTFARRALVQAIGQVKMQEIKNILIAQERQLVQQAHADLATKVEIIVE